MRRCAPTVAWGGAPSFAEGGGFAPPTEVMPTGSESARAVSLSHSKAGPMSHLPSFLKFTWLAMPRHLSATAPTS